MALGVPAAGQQPVFRTGVKLIEAAVVVHDRNGQPVADLKQSDFKIFEDGKEQKVEVFAVETDERKPRVELPPNVYSNREEQRAAGNVAIILFDRLNSTFEDQKQARDHILKYLTTLRQGDRVAFYVLESDVITILHDFTDDPARLIRAISRYVGTTSVELDRSTEKIPDFPMTGVPAEDADTAAWLARTQTAVQEIYLRRRAELTTNAFVSIAEHLAIVPGRKNLVWVSGAFPVVIPTENGPLIMNKEINRATRAINDANIAVYPVDIRGLIGAFANQTSANATVAMPSFGAKPTGNTVFTTMATTHPVQDAMRDIAEATGGRVYLNSNAIGEQVRRAIDDARVSYVLGYYAPRAQPDSKFHKIEVKVARKDVDVRYRKGYLSLPAPAARRDSRGRFDALTRVLTSPIQASQLEVMAELQRSAAGEATLTIRLDPTALTWEMKKDTREGAIDVLIAQSEPGGTYLKSKQTTVNLTAEPDRYQQMIDEGFTLTSSIEIRPTAYRLHVIVSDVASQAVGSLIIPLPR